MACDLHSFAVHRALLNERKIMHRDMSANNILVQPVHHPRTEDTDFKLAPDAAQFIADIMDGVEKLRECVPRCK